MQKKRKKRRNSLKERIADKKVPEILYTIKDKYFPDFDVYFSDNAWWIEKGKVEKLIDAFKFDCSIMEACVYAGITYDQWLHFNEKHPNFSQVKGLVSELPSLQARQTVVKGLSNDKDFALKYLERKKKDEFSQRYDCLHGEDKNNPFGGTLADAFLNIMKIDEDKKRKEQIGSRSQKNPTLPNQ